MECPHSDYTTPQTCSLCLAATRKQPEFRPPRAKVSRPFEAQFPGECDGCGERIEVGETIVRADDEYFHEGHQ
jgi:hypothetical protein